jgi:hypothetical protein
MSSLHLYLGLAIHLSSNMVIFWHRRISHVAFVLCVPSRSFLNVITSSKLICRVAAHLPVNVVASVPGPVTFLSVQCSDLLRFPDLWIRVILQVDTEVSKILSAPIFGVGVEDGDWNSVHSFATYIPVCTASCFKRLETLLPAVWKPRISHCSVL